MQLLHAVPVGAGVLPAEVANPLDEGISPSVLRTTSPGSRSQARSQLQPREQLHSSSSPDPTLTQIPPAARVCVGLSRMLAKMVHWKQHSSGKEDDDLSAWDEDFVRVPKEGLLDLITATKYLDTKPQLRTSSSVSAGPPTGFRFPDSTSRLGLSPLPRPPASASASTSLPRLGLGVGLSLSLLSLGLSVGLSLSPQPRHQPLFPTSAFRLGLGVGLSPSPRPRHWPLSLASTSHLGLGVGLSPLPRPPALASASASLTRLGLGASLSFPRRPPASASVSASLPRLGLGVGLSFPRWPPASASASASLPRLGLGIGLPTSRRLST